MRACLSQGAHFQARSTAARFYSSSKNDDNADGDKLPNTKKHPFGTNEKNYFDFAAFEEKHRRETQKRKASEKKKLRQDDFESRQ